MGILSDFTPDQAPLWSTPDVDLLSLDPMHDAFGDFSQRVIANLNTIVDHPTNSGEYIASCTFDCQLHQLKDADVDWATLKPYFGYTSTENIKNTFKVTIWYGPTHPHMITSRNTSKLGALSSTSPGITKLFLLILSSQTPLPLIMDAKWLNFLGRDILVCDAYPIKSTTQFVNTLADNIRKRGAMDTLISEGGSNEISKKSLICQGPCL